ncbi:hypothetical protein AGMMS49525_17760 [Bacteroidia bacterium]|nr:hypothetical protein AGMMS49525_17760 [Bacteroidia bacterium]
MPVEEEIAIIYAGTKGLLASVPVAKVRDFEAAYLENLRLNHKNVLAELKKGVLSEEVETQLKKVAADLAKGYA